MPEFDLKDIGKRRLYENNSCNESPDEQAFESTRKKQKISLATYESDTSEDQDSDDELGASSDNSTRKPNADEDDMFAMDNGNETKKKTSTANLELDYDQFNKENIEITSAPSEVGLSDNDSEAVQVEAFNIEEERKNGYFDKEGNYVETQDNAEDAMQNQDLWIGDVKDVREVAESQKQAAAVNRKRQKLLQESSRHYMLDEALLRLKFFLSGKETILEALAKLNKLRKTSNSNKELLVNAINFLSELITIIEQKGVEDVYSLRRPDVVKLLEEESLGSSTANEDYNAQLWYFKWFKSPQDMHGPYTNYQMQYWKQVYFKNSVAVRLRDELDEPRNWLHVDSITFM